MSQVERKFWPESYHYLKWLLVYNKRVDGVTLPTTIFYIFCRCEVLNWPGWICSVHFGTIDGALAYLLGRRGQLWSWFYARFISVCTAAVALAAIQAYLGGSTWKPIPKGLRLPWTRMMVIREILGAKRSVPYRLPGIILQLPLMPLHLYYQNEHHLT